MKSRHETPQDPLPASISTYIYINPLIFIYLISGQLSICVAFNAFDPW